MRDRQHRRRKAEFISEKSSFCSSAQSDERIANRQAVKAALDESLYTVRFNAHDARSVMNAARSKKRRPSSKKKLRMLRPNLVFASAFVLLVALPVSLYAIRSMESITIIASPNQPTIQPFGSFDPVNIVSSPIPSAMPINAPASESPSTALSESEAIRIARECFEAHCDTSIFTFDEYEVGISLISDDAPHYAVSMNSIYNNGCSFTVIVSAENGEILQYSTPRLATVPTSVDSSSAEVRAWFDKYGEHLFTWPQDAQAEFSRRYQGGSLRTAKEGEISYEAALTAVKQTVEGEAPGLFAAFYPVLYSERVSSNERAFYLVYCYASDDESVLKESTPMTISFDAVTGDIISIEGNPLEPSLGIKTVMMTE